MGDKSLIPLPLNEPVSRSTVTSQIYRQLRDGLMSGRFAPGQKLTIRGLAEDLGSSPMPVREALHRLQAEHAIDMSETGRVRIASLSHDQFREVRDARVALEGMLAEQAAVRMDAAAVEATREIFEAMQAAVDAGDQAAYLWANFAFHRSIYQSAQAELTLKVVESFWLLVGPAFTLLTPDKDHLRRSQEAHAHILRAVERRDGLAARTAVAEDIMQAAASLGELLSARHSEHGTG